LTMIRFEHIEKMLGDRRVLDDLSFQVESGDVYGLLGANGAGKTTALNILCGLLEADAGSVLFEGKEIGERTKDRFGIVPQEISLYRELTCAENLRFFAEVYGLRGERKKERVEELIGLFKLEEYAQTEIARLSGGWQRRIHIAVGLVHSPVLLVLDEPTAGLDVEARYELWERIAELKRMGVTILLTTHQLEEAERLCSRIGILQEGRIVGQGSLEELRAVVPAAQVAVVETEEEGAVCERAASMGWEYRRYGGRLNLLMPTKMTLRGCVDALHGIRLASVSLQPVRLEHVYMEMTRRDDMEFSQCGES
jgi:ABC-2 type transport system ATP-binding protein